MQRTPVLTAGAAPCERVRVTRDFDDPGARDAARRVLPAGVGLRLAPRRNPDAARPDAARGDRTHARPQREPDAARRSWEGPRRSPARPRPRRRHRSRARPRARRRAPAACGSPLPPALSALNVKVHLRGAEAWILDSTPLVGPDATYCAKIGFTDGRAVCPVRPEGNPEREACELYVTGRAADTGRPGPTWTFGGRFCTGRASGCENSAENQYQLRVFQGGTFKACGQNGVCGEVEVDK